MITGKGPPQIVAAFFCYMRYIYLLPAVFMDEYSKKYRITVK
ncbi:hypothetical protein P378_02085 [Desulforamulus profundi]|uniref:Uncharacterized protein n=1 Tax=Desulforamulus profundi TaxID=1383067 RepID=A0A2C6MEA2_9FIRM|nr:hypothetical protein P378_02085 [Desulforamulus profundi]